ncbi:hypothetical protein WISP_139413 [Willisornis vidua]|uniref:Uncharacterized protein n=1 Tax=Willisornis vidua TaxID=1566151 RepID=A0ABQ9CSR8_9PASS|nr:hypothetical protein WISP_139413 [Willisornis vidua]
MERAKKRKTEVSKHGRDKATVLQPLSSAAPADEELRVLSPPIKGAQPSTAWTALAASPSWKLSPLPPAAPWKQDLAIKVALETLDELHKRDLL